MHHSPRAQPAIIGITVPMLAAIAAGLGVSGDCRAADGLPSATLRPGEFYFRLDGTPRFLLGRNPTGWETTQFEPLLSWARDSGEKLVRIHLTSGMTPRGPAGQVDEAWARSWDEVFALAASNGLHVLPVFGAWADWNDGTRGEAWHRWEVNPYSAALGGPARAPAELFGDTACRRQWLGWLAALVRRWRDRPEVIGWEVFSELDLVSGATEAAGVEFMSQAATVVRAADPQHRPVTASLSGTTEWPSLFASDAVDLVQVHPYADLPPYHGELSALVLDCVRQRLNRYRKPVLIGECGLDSRAPQGTLVTSPRAPLEVNHAIWAALVSGAANGRMLWWEDGYDQYCGLDLRTAYRDASAPAARFAANVDFTGFKPVDVRMPERLKGAALGNAGCLIGWFRDARCVPPDWPVQRVQGQSVSLTLVGTAATWHAEFCDPRSGAVIGSAEVARQGDSLNVPLPAFEDSVALKLTTP
jgi:hypothetical protein